MANEQNLRPAWKKGQSGNPKGRPRSRVAGFKVKLMGRKTAKEFYGITPLELTEWYETLITLTFSELTALDANDDTPSIIKNYIRAIIQDMKAGRTTTVDKIVERLYGKAIQRMELTGADGSDLNGARTLTKEEARELFSNLEKDY